MHVAGHNIGGLTPSAQGSKPATRFGDSESVSEPRLAPKRVATIEDARAVFPASAPAVRLMVWPGRLPAPQHRRPGPRAQRRSAVGADGTG